MKLVNLTMPMNKRGSALVVVMASAALLSIIMVGMMSITSHMMSTLRTGDIKDTVQNEVYVAQVVLGLEKNCTANFGGLPAGSTDSKKPTKFTARSGQIYLTDGPKSYKLTKEYVLSSQDPKAGRSPVVLKEINYYRKPASNEIMVGMKFDAKEDIQGGSMRAREFPLKVLVTGGKITKCASKEEDLVEDPP